MASGNQKVKTPSGWNATQGAWVKTAGTTWKAVEQIYVKTPAGWNNASGQEATQIPYPYIANNQTPYIAAAQQPYIYQANAQSPYIANRQNAYPYIAAPQTHFVFEGAFQQSWLGRQVLLEAMHCKGQHLTWTLGKWTL
jgi:hypothetical protein